MPYDDAHLPQSSSFKNPMSKPPSHLRIHQFAGLRAGPKLLVSAAVHGNEVCGVNASQRVIDALDSGALTLLRGSVTFIPIVNPLAHSILVLARWSIHGGLVQPRNNFRRSKSVPLSKVSRTQQAKHWR